MNEVYHPELGQAMFGQPPQEYQCSEILEAALGSVRYDLSRVLWNLKQGHHDPFANESSSFRCPTFAVCSYSWDDENPQPWNFKHYASGTEVSWYKYFGRGMSVNKKVTPEEVSEILSSCLKALRLVETGDVQYDEPGLYPEGSVK